MPFGTIAWTGSSAVIASTSANGALYYWWNPGGDTSWNQETVPSPGGVSLSDAAVAWTGSAVVITALGSNGMLYFWSQAAGAPNWGAPGELPATGGVSYNAPSIAAASNNDVVIATWDSQGNLDSWYTANLGASWGPSQVAAGGGVEFRDVSIATARGNWIAAAAANNEIYSWWSSFGVAIRGQQPALIWHEGVVPDTAYYGEPSIAWTGSGAVIAATNGGDIGVWSVPYGSSNWSGPQVLPGGGSDVYPSITPVGNGLAVAGQGQGGYLYAWSQPSGSTTWSGPATIATFDSFYQGASIASLGGNSVGIAAMDTAQDNEDYWRSTNGGSSWQPAQRVSQYPCC